MEVPKNIDVHVPTNIQVQPIDFSDTVLTKEFIIFLIIFGVLLYFSERLLRKWLRVEKIKGFNTPGKGVEITGLVIIGIIFITFIPYFSRINGFLPLWYWLSFYIALHGYTAFIQWKYWDSREYVITLIFLMIMVAALIFIFNFHTIF